MENSKSFGPRLRSAIGYAWREGTVYFVLAFLIIMFTIINPRFFSGRNIYNLITESSHYVIAGMGIAFVMIGGGIDLSVGYEMAMVSTTSFILMSSYASTHGGIVPGWFILVIFAWGIFIGFLMGTLNGVICAKLKLFPLIVTMATSELLPWPPVSCSAASAIPSRTQRPIPVCRRISALCTLRRSPVCRWTCIWRSSALS